MHENPKFFIIDFLTLQGKRYMVIFIMSHYKHRMSLQPRRKMLRNIGNILPIYHVSEASDTTFRGDISDDRFFAKNGQKIDNISTIRDKLAILRKNRLGRQLITDFLAIFFCEKSILSLQCDLTAQITPVLIRRPNLNFNGNKEIQRPDCSQIVIQRPKLNFNGNLRIQRPNFVYKQPVLHQFHPFLL